MTSGQRAEIERQLDEAKFELDRKEYTLTKATEERDKVQNQVNLLESLLEKEEA